MFCLHGCLHICGLAAESRERDIGTEPFNAAELLGADALSVWTTFPNGPSGSWAVAPLCPPGAQATESLLSWPFPLRLDFVSLRAAGVEEIPEPSGQKRDLPVVRSAGAEWAGEWPARVPDTGRQTL